MLKESEYNVYKTSKDGCLLYNTLYGGMIRLESEEYEEIKNLSPHILTKEDWTWLIQNGFLVDAEIEEKSIFDALRVRIGSLINQTHCNYVIAITTACNAKCSYCYEKGVQATDMDRECADRTIRFIKANAKQDQTVFITWFGGEPLLNVDMISYIAKELRKVGVSFRSSIITNGLLFQKNIIQCAKGIWNLSQVQISLDGIEEKYNSIKNYQSNCENPFQTVIQNIKELIENEIEVSVRLNICKDNIDNIMNLIQYLGKIFPFSKYLTIYPAFINGGTTKNFFSDNEKVDVVYRVLQEIPFYSYAVLESVIYALPETTACMREKNNSILIDVDGSVCRCEHYVGRVKGESINANTKIQDYSMEYQVIVQCQQCQFYPRCLGGCMADRLDGYGFCSINRYVIEAIMQMLLE